jgi:putative FmdB family regulatory protein
MPLYEYLCDKCGHKFELLRALSDSGEAAPCPRCQSPAKRVLSSFASFSKDSSGQSTPVGGSSCSSCSSASCNSCHL